MIRKTWLILAVVALAGLLALAAACGDDDDDGGGSEEDRQALADLAIHVASIGGETATQEEIDFYLEHVTDKLVQDFGTESLAACEEDIVNCIGEPLTSPSVDPEDVDIDGDGATLVIVAQEGSFGLQLIKEDDIWKADHLFVPDDEIPDGTDIVDLSLIEFGFDADFDSEALKSGDFAFHVKNDGNQQHEVILVELPEEGAIEDLIADESFEPDLIFVKLPYGAGEESDVALQEPLSPGRYGLICFFPDTDDPEFTPHAFKGMARDFTVE